MRARLEGIADDLGMIEAEEPSHQAHRCVILPVRVLEGVAERVLARWPQGQLLLLALEDVLRRTHEDHALAEEACECGDGATNLFVHVGHFAHAAPEKAALALRDRRTWSSQLTLPKVMVSEHNHARVSAPSLSVEALECGALYSHVCEKIFRIGDIVAHSTRWTLGAVVALACRGASTAPVAMAHVESRDASRRHGGHTRSRRSGGRTGPSEDGQQLKKNPASLLLLLSQHLYRPWALGGLLI